jgi:hypothetical protein
VLTLDHVREVIDEICKGASATIRIDRILIGTIEAYAIALAIMQTARPLHIIFFDHRIRGRGLLALRDAKEFRDSTGAPVTYEGIEMGTHIIQKSIKEVREKALRRVGIRPKNEKDIFGR